MFYCYSPDHHLRTDVADDTRRMFDAIVIAQWDADRSRNVKAAPVGDDYPWGWDPQDSEIHMPHGRSPLKPSRCGATGSRFCSPLRGLLGWSGVPRREAKTISFVEMALDFEVAIGMNILFS